MKLSKKSRQKLVDWIFRFWSVMPRRAKVWAFMNDGDLQDDVKFNNK